MNKLHKIKNVWGFYFKYVLPCVYQTSIARGMMKLKSDAYNGYDYFIEKRGPAGDRFKINPKAFV